MCWLLVECVFDCGVGFQLVFAFWCLRLSFVSAFVVFLVGCCVCCVLLIASRWAGVGFDVVCYSLGLRFGFASGFAGSLRFGSFGPGVCGRGFASGLLLVFDF